jgi:hypothetical protein
MLSYSIDLPRRGVCESLWIFAIRPVLTSISLNFDHSQHQTHQALRPAFHKHQNPHLPRMLNLKQKKANSQPNPSHSLNQNPSRCNRRRLRCKTPLPNLHKRASNLHRQLPGNSSTMPCQSLRRTRVPWLVHHFHLLNLQYRDKPSQPRQE